MDIIIGGIPPVSNDLKGDRKKQPATGKKSARKERRKKDRRKSDREGIYVTLSTKDDRRKTDRRKTPD